MALGWSVDCETIDQMVGQKPEGRIYTIIQQNIHQGRLYYATQILS